MKRTRMIVELFLVTVMSLVLVADARGSGEEHSPRSGPENKAQGEAQRNPGNQRHHVQEPTEWAPESCLFCRPFHGLGQPSAPVPRAHALGYMLTPAPQAPHDMITPAQQSAVVVDRLVAVVNGEPITESDLLWLLALDPQQPDGRFTNETKRLRLEQAIDQQLLYQEARKLPAIDVKQDDISRFISDLVRQFPSEPAFRRRLETVGLDGPALQELVRQQLIILQFIEFRFRSFVLVSDAEIQTYYQGRVVRLAQERGETPPPLDDQLRSVIEQTIVEDKVESDLNDWFDEARFRAEIVRLVEY